MTGLPADRAELERRGRRVEGEQVRVRTESPATGDLDFCKDPWSMGRMAQWSAEVACSRGGCGQSRVASVGRAVAAGDEPEDEQKHRISTELRGFGTSFQRNQCAGGNRKDRRLLFFWRFNSEIVEIETGRSHSSQDRGRSEV